MTYLLAVAVDLCSSENWVSHTGLSLVILLAVYRYQTHGLR